METSAFVIDESTINVPLTNRTYKEYFNMNKLNAVIKSKKVCKIVRAWWKENDDETPEPKQVENERNYYENLMRNMRCYDDGEKKTWKLEKIQYMGSKNSKEYGRVYPKNSLSLGVMRRPIRHFLAKDDYYDVDIINAHLMIAKQKCKEFGIECEYITEYCERRDEILKEIMDSTGQNRDFAKKIFIIILNGGSWERHFRLNKVSKKKAPKFILFYEKEIKGVQEFLIKKYKDTLFPKLTAGKQTEKDKMRSFMAKYFQMIEVELLKYVLTIVSEEDICPVNELVLAHDGFMIRKHYLDNNPDFTPDFFIEYINGIFQEELEFDIEFKLKPFDEAGEIEKILKEEGIDWNEEYVCPFKEKYGIYRHEVGKINGTDTEFAEAFCKSNMDNFVVAVEGKDSMIYKLNEYGVFETIKLPELCKQYVDYMEEFMEQVKEDCFHDFKPEISNFVYQQLNALEIWYEERKDEESKKKKKKKKKGEKEEEEEKYKKDLVYDLLGYKQTKRDCKTSMALAGVIKYIEQKMELSRNMKYNKVYNQSSKKQIVNRCLEIFFHQDFLDSCDTVNHLLGFEDGVIDFKTKTFRKAKPSDGEYITMSCGYKMKEIFENHESILERKNELEKILKNMWETEGKYRLMMKALSRSLVGQGNKEEMAFFLKGVGRNGKGLLIDIMKAALGDYCSRLGYSYFAFDNKGKETAPELKSVEKARFVYVDEPPQKSTLIADIFKDATGGGEIEYRMLYSNKMRKFIMCPLWFSSNHSIHWDSDTGGESMINRIVGVKFPFTFVGKGDSRLEKDPNKYKIKDVKMKEKLSSGYYSTAMMILLLEFYGHYETEGLKRKDFPEEIRRDTAEYMEEISEEKAWFQNTIQLTDKKCYISVDHLWELWGKETGNKHGIRHFRSKVCEYYGNDCLHKNTRKARKIGNFISMTDDEIESGSIPHKGKLKRGCIQATFNIEYVKEKKSNNSYGYDTETDDDF